MNEILDALARLIEGTISRFASSHPGCRYALDCNADYGQVFVAADTAPEALPITAFFSENVEDLYSFGDWPIPNLADLEDSVESMWERRWSPYEDVIRDDWLDLSDFDHLVRKRYFLQGVCGFAADLSRRLPGIIPPILVADHDELIRQSMARMAWAFEGPPSPMHAHLTQGPWICKGDGFLNFLAFFNDGGFVNHAVSLEDRDNPLECEGFWSLARDRLAMTMTGANWEGADEFLRKEMPYALRSLDGHVLEYMAEDGEIWAYEHESQEDSE